MLQSPRFLYVLEFGDGTPVGDVAALSGYEVAARLALTLWRSVPDDALMAAAAAGLLAMPDQMRDAGAFACSDRRPRRKSASIDFTAQWMQLQNTATALGKDA